MFRDVVEGEWGEVPRRAACCDCGLVHRLEWVIVSRRGRRFVQVRMWRDDEATARERERMEIEKCRS